MGTRTERDKNKSLQDKHQTILGQLLKDEDNKYCVDCDAKGPRWASWNLGIFLCIRCAGIHRNMGVHISKVKSVNLDTWTSEQVAMVQDMGNSKARAVYEANLPDNFRRPQTDSGLEAFMRSKYEHKKYIAKEWVPPQHRHVLDTRAKKVDPGVVPDEPKKEKKKSRPKPNTGSIQLPVPAAKTSTLVNTDQKTEQKSSETSKVKERPHSEKAASSQQSATVDLLGLDTPAISTGNAAADIFTAFMSADSTPTLATSHSAPSLHQPQPPQATPGSDSNGLASEGLDPDLFGDGSGAEQQRKSTKDDILKLYGNQQQQQQQQPYGVPGGSYSMPGMMAGGGGAQNGMMPAGSNMMPQGNMGMMPGQMPSNIPMQQPNMMMGGQMGAVPQAGMGGMMPQGGQAQGMMAGGGMQAQQQQQQQQQANNTYMANMYNMQQQQQLQQAQQQMSGLSMGGAPVGVMPQAGTVAAGAGNWGPGQQSGHTLSNNLWQ